MSELPEELLQFFKQQADLYPDDFYLKPIVENQDIQENIQDFHDDKFSSTDEEIILDSGSRAAKIVFVCTRPLKDDLISQKLITGEAGKLFDKIIKAIDLTREDVYITSLRSVSKAGKLSEESRLDLFEKTIGEIKPEIIISLGENAGNEILNEKNNLDEVHGKIFDYNGIKFMFTFHPELVRLNQKLKRPVWEDFKKIKEIVQN